MAPAHVTGRPLGGRVNSGRFNQSVTPTLGWKHHHSQLRAEPQPRILGTNVSYTTSYSSATFCKRRMPYMSRGDSPSGMTASARVY